MAFREELAMRARDMTESRVGIELNRSIFIMYTYNLSMHTSQFDKTLVVFTND